MKKILLFLLLLLQGCEPAAKPVHFHEPREIDLEAKPVIYDKNDRRQENRYEPR